MNCEYVEDVWIETKLNNQKLIIGSIYRHPNTDIEIFTQHFENALDKLQYENCKVYICGDFNVDALKMYTNTRTMEYYNTVLTQNFLPTITLPTRITESSATIIDNIFMKLDNKTLNDRIESGNIYSDITDHLPNILMIKSENINENIQKRPFIRLQGPKNVTKFKNILADGTFDEVLEKQNPNCILEFIYEKYQKAYEESFPLHMLSRKRMKDKKWITPAIRKSINHKSKLFKAYLHNPCEQNKTNYKKYRNILTSIIRKAEELYYSNMIDDKKKNFRALWEIFSPVINPNKQKRKKNIDRILHNDQEINTDREIAETLNEHFISVGKKLVSPMNQAGQNSNDYLKYLCDPCNASIFMFATNKIEIKQIVKEFKNKKASGDDDISNKLLKLISDLLPLDHLINQILRTGIYPDKLKIGKVIPIHKGKSTEIPNNYRPITLLSCINKIIEKIIYKRIYLFLEKKNIFHENQFGFRRYYSTSLALINVVEEIRECIDDKKMMIGLFLDLTKAFDLVNHKILLKKLNHCGIRGVANSLIESYLTNRKQYVQIKNEKSKLQSVEMGVPQGSVLGPLLFLVYINDLAKSVSNCSIKMFADDTSVFLRGDDPKHLREQAERCLVNLSDWFKANKLVINDNKTTYVVFTKKKCIPDILSEIKLHDTIIQRKFFVKYLGIILDARLDFKEYITQLTKKLIKIIGAFKIIKNFIPNNNKMKLYNAYFHSKLNYGIEVYGSCACRYLKKVDILQHKALKVLFKHEPLTSSLFLLNKYKLLSIKDHHNLNIAKFIFQCTRDKIPSSNKFYENNMNSEYPNTRNRDLLKLPQVRTEQGKCMIKYKGAKIFNTFISDTCSLFKNEEISLRKFVLHFKTKTLQSYQ